jgi:hypothetical protein
MKKSIIHSTFSLFILISNLLSAQQYDCVGYRCLAPPVPPAFLPNENYVPVSRSGNNYKIPFDTIVFNPTLGTQAFDVVICVDGVTNNTQIAQADNYIDSLVKRLQTVAQYQPRFKYFNIYRVGKLSAQQGAAYGFTGDTAVNNRYGSRFNAYHLPRLLIPSKYDTLFADANEFVPHHDLVLMLAFDKKYGGSGWNLYDGRKVASFSIDEETGWHLSDEVIIHEMQHVMPFAGHGYLGDEYEDSVACSIYDTIPIAYTITPNFTDDTINKRKWQHCIGLPNVGFYLGAGICPGNYRPTPLCAMRQVFQLPDFCPVCRENSTAYFDSMINPLYNSSATPAIFSGDYTFRVSVDTPTVNTYRYRWLLDDSVLIEGVDTLLIHFDLMDHYNNHLLRFECTDTDAHIVDTTLRRPWITAWNLLTRDTALAVNETGEEITFSVFPNPANSKLTVALGMQNCNCTAQILSADGKMVLTDTPLVKKETDLDISKFANGVYMLEISANHHKKLLRFLKQ